MSKLTSEERLKKILDKVCCWECEKQHQDKITQAIAEIKEWAKEQKEPTCRFCVVSCGIGVNGEVKEIIIHCTMDPRVEYRYELGIAERKE